MVDLMIRSPYSTLEQTDLRSALERKIKERKAVVAILGLGYVGLPLAMVCSQAGFRVVGIDSSEKKIDILTAGKSDVDDVTDEEVKKFIAGGKILPTSDFTRLQKADCIAICVPTPLNKTKDPDVSFILSAAEAIKNNLRKGQLVILESTTYPGTTEELIRPILESTGMKAGEDFYLAFSPERIDPGNEQYTTKNTPKVVGGVDPISTKLVTLFYRQVVNGVVTVSSSQSAEMVKLLENTFRSVNIALVNEVALMCDRLGIDVWEVIDAAATKPFGFLKFYPGPGLGGHCIPIDPHYLSWKLRSLNYYARFIELAGDINSHMPAYVVEKIGTALNRHMKSYKGAKILILGVSYKKDISDVRESPALDIMKLLDDQGAKITYNDPHVPKLKLDHGVLKSVKLTKTVLNRSDCAVIVADHSRYDYDFIVRESKLVVDTRNATKAVKIGRNKIIKL